jgi:hypothetical protein
MDEVAQKTFEPGPQPRSLFCSSPSGNGDSGRSRMVIARCPGGLFAGKVTRALCQCGNSHLETRAILILGAGSPLR